MKKLPKVNTSKLLKAALPYILVGLMATKLGQAYRMASGGDVLDRILGAFLKIGEAFANPLPSLHPFDLLVGDACGALLWFIVYQKSKNARKYRRGAEYGTARWGNAKDIEPFIDPDFSQNILLSETERLTLGKIADPEKRNVNLNVLVIGGSGSGKVSLEISENCTIYVTVTDKNGKSHTKNRYIEVFDREAPTIRAGIEGELLRVEASDDLSGVDKIYVCGNSFSKLNNGTLDIRLKDYADNYEQITIQATDRAGNKSRMTQLNNPYYEEPKKDSDKTSSSPTSPSIPASTVTTPTGGGTGTTLSQSGTGGTASTGQTAKPTGGTISSSNKADTEKDPSAVSPVATEETEDNPFTPDGSATVVDNATDEQGKEFYTIMTPDENVFYLIIDKQRDSENVYFLNAVTESDLMALAQKDTDSQTVTPTAPSEPEPAAPAEPEEPSEPETSEPEPEQPAPKSNNSMMFLVIVAALAAGGLGYYFKVYKPKHDLDDAEDIDDFEFEGPEEPTVNEDEEATGEDAGQEELSEEEEAEQRRLYEEDNEDIPIEGDDDLVF